MMAVQLNTANLLAMHTLMHYIVICRPVPLLFPVIESKHRKPVEEGCSDCQDSALCQAVPQRSRPVGHHANLSGKEVCLTPARPSTPRLRVTLMEALDEGGWMWATSPHEAGEP